MNNDLMKILESSAWYDGRQKDIGYVEIDLIRAGLSKPNETIFKFLSEFEYVCLEYQSKSGVFITVHFSADLGIENTPIEFHSNFEEVCGEKLVPIGCLGENIGIIEMSYSGKFFLIVPEEGIFSLGDNFESAMMQIFFQEKLSKVADLPYW